MAIFSREFWILISSSIALSVRCPALDTLGIYDSILHLHPPPSHLTKPRTPALHLIRINNPQISHSKPRTCPYNSSYFVHLPPGAGLSNWKMRRQSPQRDPTTTPGPGFDSRVSRQWRPLIMLLGVSQASQEGAGRGKFFFVFCALGWIGIVGVLPV
jgi:hypothetical protein